MNDWAKGEGQPGLAYIFWREGEEGGAGPIAKNIGVARARGGPRPAWTRCRRRGVLRRRPPEGFREICRARPHQIGTDLGMIDRNRFDFCWIVDFPMYEWNEEEKKIDFSHNPFSMPNMSRENFWPSMPTTTIKFSASRRSSTTSSATASNCRPAPSAIIAPM